MRFGFAIVTMVSLVAASLGIRRRRKSRNEREGNNVHPEDKRESILPLALNQPRSIIEIEAINPPRPLCGFVTFFQAGSGRIIELPFGELVAELLGDCVLVLLMPVSGEYYVAREGIFLLPREQKPIILMASLDALTHIHVNQLLYMAQQSASITHFTYFLEEFFNVWVPGPVSWFAPDFSQVMQ